MGMDDWEYAWEQVVEERLIKEQELIREYANDLLEGREPQYTQSYIQKLIEENSSCYDQGTKDLLIKAEKIRLKRIKSSAAGVMGRKNASEKVFKRIKKLVDKYGADSTHEAIRAAYKLHYKKEKAPSISTISRMRRQM